MSGLLGAVLGALSRRGFGALSSRARFSTGLGNS